MHSIRASCLLQFKELVTELGADPDAILRHAGLPPEDAGRPDRFISLRSAVQALETAADATSTPEFGRRLAARRSIETIGPLGVAAQSEANLSAAIGVFSTFISTHSPGLQVRLTPDTHGETSFFEFRIVLEPAPRQCQAIEVGLGAALQILRAILGPTYSPLAVQLPHSPLTTASDYVRDFGSTAHFAQPAAGFTLRAADLRRSLRPGAAPDPDALAELSTLADSGAPPLSQVVTDLVRSLLPTGTLTIELTAERLDLHPRTLQRRLAKETTSFVALVDKVRRQTAQHYLRDTDISLEHLTRLLGYSEQSVLTRSCQRWFAASPTSYRNSPVPRSDSVAPVKAAPVTVAPTTATSAAMTDPQHPGRVW